MTHPPSVAQGRWNLRVQPISQQATVAPFSPHTKQASGERTTLWAQALTLPLEKGRGGGSQPASLESPSLEMTFIVPVEGDQSCRSEMKHISPTDVSGPCVGSLGLMLQVGVVLHPHGPSGDGAAAAFQCCRARGCR